MAEAGLSQPIGARQDSRRTAGSRVERQGRDARGGGTWSETALAPPLDDHGEEPERDPAPGRPWPRSSHPLGLRGFRGPGPSPNRSLRQRVPSLCDPHEKASHGPQQLTSLDFIRNQPIRYKSAKNSKEKLCERVIYRYIMEESTGHLQQNPRSLHTAAASGQASPIPLLRGKQSCCHISHQSPLTSALHTR